MSDAQYQWLLTIFYIPYVVFEWLALMVYSQIYPRQDAQNLMVRTVEAHPTPYLGFLHCPYLVGFQSARD